MESLHSNPRVVVWQARHEGPTPPPIRHHASQRRAERIRRVFLEDMRGWGTLEELASRCRRKRLLAGLGPNTRGNLLRRLLREIADHGPFASP